MASFGEFTSSFFFAVFVIVVMTGASSGRQIDIEATINDLSGDICPGTQDVKFCLQVMKSIPGAAQASSPQSLLQVLIPFAHSEAQRTENYAKSLTGTAKNPRIKANYDSCAANYNNAVGDMENAQQMLKNRDYPGISTMASSGITNAGDCDDYFKGSSTTDPSQLPQKNKYFSMVCVVILRVVNKLHAATL